MIRWICSSVADSCIATIIRNATSCWLLTSWLMHTGKLDAASQEPSVIHLGIQFGFVFQTRGFRSNFVPLNLPHNIHDAFIDVQKIVIGQGTTIDTAHVVKNRLLPVWLVDGHACVTF